jgi:integrase
MTVLDSTPTDTLPVWNPLVKPRGRWICSFLLIPTVRRDIVVTASAESQHYFAHRFGARGDVRLGVLNKLDPFLGSFAVQRFFVGPTSTFDELAVLEDWIIAMRARGMQRGGINTTWRGLIAAFRWLTRPSGTVNPLRFVDAPKAGRPSVSFLTREAAEEVWRFVRNRLWRSEFERSRNSVIIGLMLLAGLRRGEAIRLRRGDVTVATGALLLRRTKGRDGGRTRMAHMPPQLRTVIEEYFEILRTLPPRRHLELLTSERNAPLSAGTITRLCAIISRESGVEVAPHMLRHSYATLLRQSGVPDRIAMELMGHADLRMLLRYSHVEAEEPRRAAEQLVLGE